MFNIFLGWQKFLVIDITMKLWAPDLLLCDMDVFCQ